MIPHIAILLAGMWLAACQPKPFPEGGEIVLPPIGYVEMCEREPGSVFCVRD